MGLVLREIAVEGYERIIEVVDESVGLNGIIAIHDTRLGPALGGIRVWPYANFDEALTDALRLSRGMTYKSAATQTGTGGGKSVIRLKKDQKLEEGVILSFGEAIEKLGGLYIGAEDVGMSPHSLMLMRSKTRHLVGLPHPKSSGDPSRFTAWGGFRGVLACCYALFGDSSVSGKTVAIQGLGAVGMKLANYLFWAGAKLVVTDIDDARVDYAVREFDAKAVPIDEIHRVKCEIFAPCALGGGLNSKTIPELGCKAVAGLANNQLLNDSDGEALFERGILYAPDYVINSAGLLNVCAELEEHGYNPLTARDRVNRIYDHLLNIFTLAKKQGISTAKASQKLAEEYMARHKELPKRKLFFHH